MTERLMVMLEKEIAAKLYQRIIERMNLASIQMPKEVFKLTRRQLFSYCTQTVIDEAREEYNNFCRQIENELVAIEERELAQENEAA